jgi:major membrane immunogen (membrane-anchored lipoprotein)
VLRGLGLAALLGALLLVTGCGGDDSSSTDAVSQVPTEGGLQQRVRTASQPRESDFPSAKGKTLQQLAEEIKGGGSVEAGLATSVFTVGKDRLAFGVIDDQGQFVYGKTAVYVAPTPNDRAKGPFVAPADVLATEGRYRSKQAATETDPFAAVYQSEVPFDKKGKWAVLTVTMLDGRLVAAPAQVQVNTKQADPIPDVGEQAPRVKTDSLASAKGNVESIDTRVPPSDMHAHSFDEVVGKKPVALLFSTPQLCQSRVCGPVTDIALQMKAKYGDRMEFIHQEVYADNDPNKGLREPLKEFRLRTEPWLFIVNAQGKITARLEGSFGIGAFEHAIKTGL